MRSRVQILRTLSRANTLAVARTFTISSKRQDTHSGNESLTTEQTGTS